jgi:hypothetical protein
MNANDPATVVQRQLDAYNARDVEALLATYAPDARQYELGGALLASGHAEMRPRFIARFAEPHLHAHLVQRMVADNVVIDHEIVTRNFPEGQGELVLVAIYDVRDGKIQTQTVSFGAITLDAKN